jgi:hypothetical protein
MTSAIPPSALRLHPFNPQLSPSVSYPIWTDSRRQLDPVSGCSRNLAMEEVFPAKITP